MARLNIKNIENVEGKYHVMFLEGKNIVDSAKSDTHWAVFSLLVFLALLLLFVVITGFNIYYAYFALAFLAVFFTMLIYLKIQKRKGKKQCVYAVKNSKTTNIVAKQVDNRRASRAIVKSMSSTIDKYDARKKFPSAIKSIKRKRKHEHIVDAILEFENETEKKTKRKANF